jgi:hypothetical protein
MSGPKLSIIPAVAIEDQRLTGLDLRVLLYLGKHANTKSGWCRVRQKPIAAAMGCARSTLQLSLGKLEGCGYIEVRLGSRPASPPANPNKRPYAANEYRVRFDVEAVAGKDRIEVVDECEYGEPDTSGTACPTHQARGADPIASAPIERLSGNEAAAPAARPGLIRSEAHKIAEEIATLNGIDPKNPPPAWFGASMRVEAWLSRGWTRDAIMVGINRVLARGTAPPKRIEYFEGAIADAIAAANKPVPKAPGRSGENRHATSESPVTAAIRRHLTNQISFGERPKGVGGCD